VRSSTARARRAAAKARVEEAGLSAAGLSRDRRLLRIGDTVLSTLAGVVLLAEPLREGKEFIEHVAGTVADGVPE
jgi:hypothetical protein